MGLLDLIGFGTISDEKRAKIYAKIDQENRWAIEKVEKRVLKDIKQKVKHFGWKPQDVIMNYVNNYPNLIVPSGFRPRDERKMPEYAEKWAWWFIQKYSQYFPLNWDPFGFLNKQASDASESNADKLEELRLKKEILEMELKLKQLNGTKDSNLLHNDDLDDRQNKIQDWEKSMITKIRKYGYERFMIEAIDYNLTPNIEKPLEISDKEWTKKWIWRFIQKYPEFFPLDYDPFAILAINKLLKNK